MSDLKKRKLFIVSNRLPVSISEQDGRYRFQQSVGGLATGLTNMLEKVKGYWIGWPGAVDIAPNRRHSFDWEDANPGWRSSARIVCCEIADAILKGKAGGYPADYKLLFIL